MSIYEKVFTNVLTDSGLWFLRQCLFHYTRRKCILYYISIFHCDLGYIYHAFSAVFVIAKRSYISPNANYQPHSENCNYTLLSNFFVPDRTFWVSFSSLQFKIVVLCCCCLCGDCSFLILIKWCIWRPLHFTPRFMIGILSTCIIISEKKLFGSLRIRQAYRTRKR